MAMTIVEELWTRIRAVIDDKIVAAEDAAVRAEGVAAAFGSLEGVVDQVQAASGYAQAALAEADRSSSEADRAEAAAQSASTGVQTDTVGRLHLTPALRGEIDGKAAASHQHSWSDVTDKPSTYPPESHSHTASQIGDATATGRAVLTASSAAAARTAIGAAPASHTHSEYAEASRVSALEGNAPIIVSSLPSSPLPGRIYLVTG